MIGIDHTAPFNQNTMFDTWSDEQFNAWFAGFFDGEGCVYIPKNTVGMEISVANTEREVIVAIRERLGLGIIMEVKFSANNWKTKYHWRLRNMPEIHDLLTRLRPFLTIKLPKADEAIRIAGEYIGQKTRRLERNAAIIEMLRTHKQCEVARAFNLTRQTIADIRDAGGSVGQMGRRRRGVPDTELRTAVQTHHKDLVKVTTTSSELR